MKKGYQISIHVICWLIFGAWAFYLVHGNSSITFKRVMDSVTSLGFGLLTFYFNWYVLIPKYLARNRILVYIAAVLAMLAAIALVRAPLDYYVFREFNLSMNSPFSSELLVNYMVGGLVVVFVSSALKITGNYIKNERLNKELENQKLVAELGFLKSQVNPHFLFNTLNNIYSLAYKQSPETPDAIMKLSLLMRYMLYESNDNLVCLQKEVDHLHNFIDLQKLRLREQTSIKFEISGDLEGKQIAPMMLMTLVENAFKHGLVSKNEIGIIFNLDVQDSFLCFTSVNNTSTHKKREYGGIGLENLKRRLNLIYPNRHNLSLEEKEGAFYATLTIYYQKSNSEKL